MRSGTSLPQQPENEAQQRGYDQSRRERQVEREAFALETKVARQASEAELREPGPGDADDDENDTERNEEAAHVACARQTWTSTARQELRRRASNAWRRSRLDFGQYLSRS